ncbi:MAG: phosphatase PAP2 family protein [Thermoleophilia bacterium]|nr:phosphatase PAP2 family protein [Thermoleophilia bacterium]
MARTPAPRRSAAAALASLSILAAVATAAAFALAVHTSAGQRLDDAARGDVSLSAAPRAYAATERLLETISVSSLALFGLGIMGVALLRGRPALAVGAGVAVLGANLTTQAMKARFDRPDLVDGGRTIDGAFPSGHVTVAMSLALALILVVPPAARWTAALAGCLYAAGVGIAVIALDWHRPSEAVGAYLVATAWTAAVAAVLVAAGEGRRGGRPEHPGAGRAGAIAAAVAAIAFAAVVGTSAARRLDVVRIADDRTAFAVAAVVVAASCGALGTTVTRLLQRADSDNGADRAADR